MQPIINVKGTKLSVVSIHYRANGKPSTVYAADENGRESLFVEKSQSQYDDRPHVAVENLAELLEYPDANKQIVDDLVELVKDSKDHLKVLGNQIIQEVLTHDGLPFGDSALPNLAKEYKEQSDYIDGVVSALEIVKRDNYA
ncbi:hypothetical protein [Lysinibacillus sp. G4S2]|uniref:hypothetical protein n=1 Tax=Lysinibacillus sp. G4S2 TaxID=3055859 RepID=UPI0025A16D9A|nr:hypothetical protein [Lysinibacillus sp. G4S2]MDM5245722.1 hypothetical protein [Lysinibacillus sp. G4S2]